MNTGQKYVGRGTHANDSKQSANSLPASGPPKGQSARVDEPNQRLYQELHQSLGDYISSNGASHCTRLLEELYLGWSLYHFGDDSPETTPFIRVNKQLIEDAFSVVEFMAFITHIGETWNKIDAMEKALSSTDHEQATNE